MLLGFWRGFRCDELSRIEIQHVQVVPGEGMSLFLPFNKTQYQGETYKAPALARLCPVDAYQAWIDLSALDNGPVFRGVNRWGHISDRGLHPVSFIPLLRDLFARAEIPSPESYSSHSLRWGFASWATANGWDLKTLMNYVGWKDIRSAMRYLPVNDPFSQLGLSGKPLISNSDAAAAAKGQLRGEFYPSHSHGLRWEKLTYRGVHIVEAFLIKNNQLIGQSQPFYVTIV